MLQNEAYRLALLAKNVEAGDFRVAEVIARLCSLILSRLAGLIQPERYHVGQDDATTKSSRRLLLRSITRLFLID